MKLLDNCANLDINNIVNATAAGQARQLIFTQQIDLRTVIGDEYYKNYETFAICLNSVSTFFLISSYSIPGIAGTAPGTTVVQVGMSGLPFINTSTNGILDNIPFFPEMFTLRGGLEVNAFNNINVIDPKKKPILFKKPKNSVVTLGIGLYSVRNPNGPMNMTNSAIPFESTMDFSFSIFPVVE
jgi:hypothetical protein